VRALALVRTLQMAIGSDLQVLLTATTALHALAAPEIGAHAGQHTRRLFVSVTRGRRPGYHP
jgi:hypothetical protein